MIVDLGGDAWSVREALGDTWQWFVDKPVHARNNAGAAAETTARSPGWLPARVPGAVIADLHRAGELPDPYVGRNSRCAEWVAARSWVYRRDIEVRQIGSDEVVVLCLDGVDPGGWVYLDGTYVGRVEGLYAESRFDITAQVAEGGTHRLAVVVDPAPANEPQVGRTERVTVHAPRIGYGWDFAPRLIHQGLWRGARLEIAEYQVAEMTARPELDGDLESGRVHLAGTVDVPTGSGVELEVRVRRDESPDLAGARDVVARHPVRLSEVVETSPGRTEHRLDAVVDVQYPTLWWPRGLGDQSLYTVEMWATGTAATEGDMVWSATVGFRHVRMVTEADGLAYRAVVNGRRVELIGWNWAPADVLYGEIDRSKVDHLVEMAATSGARLLRVWGGGLVETPEFYDACDRAGVFVWQEFSQSSSGMQSAPSQTSQFVEHLRGQARVVVPPRTRHPSLMIWGGGNELEDDAGPLDENRSPALRALRDEVATLDPGRSWLPSSPTGPEFANRLDVIETNPAGMHDVHGPWEHQGLEEHYTLYNRGQALAHTEFGVEGMANRRLWSRLVPPEDRWPVGRDNPVYRHLGDWWNNAELVGRCFGGRLDVPDAFRRASQFMQATGLAYAVEADRRRWPWCSMTLPWQLAESYPNAWCTAAVDFAGEAKPVFYAVQRAFRAERITARVDRIAHGGDVMTLEPWLWSESGRDAGGRVDVRLLDDSGRCVAHRWWRFDDHVTEPCPVGRFDVDPSELESGATPIMLWDLQWRDAEGALVDHECMPLATGPDLSALLDLPVAELMFHVEPATDRRWTVTVDHLSGPAVFGLQLSDDRPAESTGWAVVDGDPRPLLPGRQRKLTVEWRDDAGPRVLRLESWNTVPIHLGDTMEEPA